MTDDKGVGLTGWLSGPRHKVSKAERDRSIALDKHRIAVLPLSNISPDPNDAYFADGMTEEIISTLSGVSGVNVVARTSVMGYKATTKKVREIANELEVGSILEGSFRKAGNRIRVTVQLIDIVNDKHVWSQSYDRQLDDVFAVQTDIAKRVAETLRIKIPTEEAQKIGKRPTENTKAYSLYLRGRYHLNRRSIEDILKAIEYFDQAVGEAPEFALGHVGVADSHQLLADWGRDIRKNHEIAKTAADRALELDSDLAEAHATRGLLLMSDFNLRGAEKEFNDALELKPSYATAHLWYSRLLLHELRWDEALEHVETAVELDPFSQIINRNHASYYESKRDYARALELYKRAAELDPNLSIPHFELARVYYKMKMFDAARRENKTAFDFHQMASPPLKRNEAMTAYWEGDKDTVRKVLPDLEAHVGEPLIDAFIIAGLHFYLDEIDEGFEWLEQSYARREYDLLDIQSDEKLDGIRSDPRYRNLLKRLGMQ